MDAREPRRVQTGFQLAHRLPQDVRFTATVKTDIIVGRFNPVDLTSLHEDDAAAVPDGYSIRQFAPIGEVLDESGEAAIGRFRTFLRQVDLRAVQRFAEALPVERLEQVV